MMLLSAFDVLEKEQAELIRSQLRTIAEKGELFPRTETFLRLIADFHLDDAPQFEHGLQIVREDEPKDRD